MITRPDNDASGAVSCAIVTLITTLALAAAAALCAATVGATAPTMPATPRNAAGVEETAEEERAAEYGPPHDSDGGLEGTRCYHYDPDRECIDMPAAMAAQAPFLWLGCEVRAVTLGPVSNAWDHAAALAAATGRLGERGQSQLHPIHRAGMERAGLDYEDEGDRLRYAVTIWQRTESFRDWSCR